MYKSCIIVCVYLDDTMHYFILFILFMILTGNRPEESYCVILDKNYYKNIFFSLSEYLTVISYEL